MYTYFICFLDYDSIQSSDDNATDPTLRLVLPPPRDLQFVPILYTRVREKDQGARITSFSGLRDKKKCNFDQERKYCRSNIDIIDLQRLDQYFYIKSVVSSLALFHSL